MEAEYGESIKYFICDVFTRPRGYFVPTHVGALYLTTHYSREERSCETHSVEGRCCHSEKMKAFMLRKGYFKIFKIGKEPFLEISISPGNELKNTDLLEYCPYSHSKSAVYTVYDKTIYETASQAESSTDDYDTAQNSYHVVHMAPSKCNTEEEGGFAIMHRVTVPTLKKCPSTTFVSFVQKEEIILDYDAKYCCPVDFSSKSFQIGPDCLPLNFITEDQKESKTIICYA